jgi:peptidyl-dipeptidase Dcp
MTNSVFSHIPKLPYDAINFPFYNGELFKRAFDEAIEKTKERVKALSENQETPTFENTIEELEHIDSILAEVQGPFTFSAFDSTDDILEVEEYIADPLSRLCDEMYQDEGIWKRVQYLVDHQQELDLEPDQEWLLEQTKEGFIQAGALLSESQKQEVQDLNSDMAQLSVQFTKNILEATQQPLLIKDESLLKGLSDESVQVALDNALEKNLQGWAFDISMPSAYKLLKESESSEFREKMWHAFYNRGSEDPYDTEDLIKKILIARTKVANIMGYKNWASYVLDENMAKTPERTLELMNLVWDKVKVKFEKLSTRLQKESKTPLKPWDWFHYSDVVLSKDFSFNEKEFNSYLLLSNVKQGLFDTVHKIFGLNFNPVDLPGFAPDVKSYVVSRDGKDVGLFYADDYQRSTKRGGAWMEQGRSQHRLDGVHVLPFIGNAMNVEKNKYGDDTHINVEEMVTLFHEMGHGLHGLLSNVRYPSQSGTSVPTDFVELPSQLLENWCFEPSVLKTFAKNEKGETIPDKLIDSWKKVQNYQNVYDRSQYLVSAFQDIRLHMLSLEEIEKLDLKKFEEDLNKELGVPKLLMPRYNLKHFNHVFGWDYSSRYYAYLWSAVLDSDVFEHIKEKGLFDKEACQALEKEIYSVGHTRDVEDSFRAFMGRDPDVSALLKRDGLVNSTSQTHDVVIKNKMTP